MPAPELRSWETNRRVRGELRLGGITEAHLRHVCEISRHGAVSVPLSQETLIQPVPNLWGNRRRVFSFVPLSFLDLPLLLYSFVPFALRSLSDHPQIT